MSSDHDRLLAGDRPPLVLEPQVGEADGGMTGAGAEIGGKGGRAREGAGEIRQRLRRTGRAPASPACRCAGRSPRRPPGGRAGRCPGTRRARAATRARPPAGRPRWRRRSSPPAGRGSRPWSARSRPRMETVACGWLQGARGRGLDAHRCRRARRPGCAGTDRRPARAPGASTVRLIASVAGSKLPRAKTVPAGVSTCPCSTVIRPPSKASAARALPSG